MKYMSSFELLTNDTKCKRCRFFKDGECKALKRSVKKNEFCSMTKQQIERANEALRKMFED